MHMCNMNALSLLVQKLWPRISLFKVEQQTRSRSQGQNCWHQQIGLAARNTHVWYESPVSYGSKAMTKVKFLWTERFLYPIPNFVLRGYKNSKPTHDFDRHVLKLPAKSYGRGTHFSYVQCDLDDMTLCQVHDTHLDFPMKSKKMYFNHQLYSVVII